MLAQRFNLDANILRDVRDAQELPRVEYANNALYLFLRIPRISKKSHVVTTPLLVLAQAQNFFTLGHEESVVPDQIMESGLSFRAGDTHKLLLTTLAAVINEYEQLIRRTERTIAMIKSRLLSHEIDNRDFVQFIAVEENLSIYIMNLQSMVAIMEQLRTNRRGLFSHSDIEAIDDAVLHAQQLVAEVNSDKQTVTSVRDAYTTIASNTLNQRMRVLTLFTVMITIPNVFFGMYGMNVGLPFYDQPWAYGAIVGFTVLLSILIYLLAKRLRIF